MEFTLNYIIFKSFKNLYVMRIFYLTMILVSISLLYSCGGSTERSEKARQQPHSPEINHPKELKQDLYDFDNPPIFRRDGELVFIDAETGEAISEIVIEIASTDFQRQLGLMYRSEMEYDHGMLFLFDREIIQSFWMRNTLIPLDIIYINSSREIVDIHTTDVTMSDKSFVSSSPAVYVLEVNAGFCEENGIKIGDKIIF